ncbi:timeless-domain-containing protein [Phellopilus nigrolimitatus]|nr:timeless-domain-containing protein [Phellopilus nigrolimitatus]
MDNDDVISISSDDREQPDRRAILAPAIHDVIAALGGYEGTTYTLGDECYGCLKDLKKFWRKDDTDDERTVARIFWEARVLPNDLVPILLETAGKGLVGDKCAIACADIITAMTWPIDLSEELKELDEEFDKGTDYTQLLQSHLHYKAALLRPGVIQALFGILLPCIAKEKKERKEQDSQIVNVVLHLLRNLAFIKDRPSNMHASADQAELSSLQSKLVKTFSEAHVLDLLITIASSASDPFFNQWNTLVLEILYLVFRGVLPSSLAIDQKKRTQMTLSKLLETENKVKLENARRASSRHSRFGTTISVSLNPAKMRSKKDGDAETSSSANAPSQAYILHHQQALNEDAGSILDMKKKKQYKKTNKVDELGVTDNLDYDAKNTVAESRKDISFLASLLKDIKSERPKITEKDHLRLLFVAKWFLEFFLSVRSSQLEASEKKDLWGFDLVAEVVERGWIVWILKRMREAVEDKPKLWTELQAGIECLTQLLLLIDSMHASGAEVANDPELSEAATLLQQQIVYNGEVLDIAVDALRAYKEGVQSLRFLDASVRLGYSLLRMLEKWARERGGGELYVRRKKVKRGRRGKNKDGVDEEEVPEEHEAPNSDDEHAVREIIFTFETFELKFAHEEIAHTLLTYLGRYDEFTSSEQMKRVVNLMHRQAVKAKAEGLFFKVSTLNLFKSILARQSSLPREQPYKDLAFFPKNRNRWKQYSSWEPEPKENKRGKNVDTQDNKHPPDVQHVLVDNGQQELIDWVKEILTMVVGQRQRIVEETDGSSSQSQLNDMDDDAVRDAASNLRQPSNEAMAKFEDYLIPYISDEQADAATKNPHLKLVFRLAKFFILDENSDELEWYVPASILPSDLQSSLVVIDQFLETPLDLGGKKASQMLSKKIRGRRRRRRAASDDEDEAKGLSSEDEEPRKKRTKKKKEERQYKSAQFIEDSDVEYGDDDAFWARERAQREKTERLAAEGKSWAMHATGTKKRKKQRGGVEEREKAEGRSSPSESESDEPGVTSGTRSTSATTQPQDAPARKPAAKKKAKPRPKPRYKGAMRKSPAPVSPPTTTIPSRPSSALDSVSSAEDDTAEVHTVSRKTKTRIVLSDEDD